MKYSFPKFFSIALVVFVCACRQVEVVDVAFFDENLVFVFDQKYENISLANVQMKKVDCEFSCIYLDLRAEMGEDDRLNYAKLNGNKLTYGEPLPPMVQNVPAKKITPGNYSASGTVLSPKGVGKIFVTDFNIKEDSKGNLMVSQN